MRAEQGEPDGVTAPRMLQEHNSLHRGFKYQQRSPTAAGRHAGDSSRSVIFLWRKKSFLLAQTRGLVEIGANNKLQTPEGASARAGKKPVQPFSISLLPPEQQYRHFVWFPLPSAGWFAFTQGQTCLLSLSCAFVCKQPHCFQQGCSWAAGITPADSSRTSQRAKKRVFCSLFLALFLFLFIFFPFLFSYLSFSFSLFSFCFCWGLGLHAPYTSLPTRDHDLTILPLSEAGFFFFFFN